MLGFALGLSLIIVGVATSAVLAERTRRWSWLLPGLLVSVIGLLLLEHRLRNARTRRTPPLARGAGTSDPGKGTTRGPAPRAILARKVTRSRPARRSGIN